MPRFIGMLLVLQNTLSCFLRSFGHLFHIVDWFFRLLNDTVAYTEKEDLIVEWDGKIVVNGRVSKDLEESDRDY
jgi:hypothetical protein